MAFTSFGFTQVLQDAIKASGMEQPTPIQEKSIPFILKGNDVLGIAPTGSGKTASYALPILQLLLSNTQDRSRNVDALIIVPTRELAIQVQDVFHDLIKLVGSSLKSKAVFGGVAINPQMKALFGVNILIATPGRLLELAELNAVKLNKTQVLVLDEADKLLNLGFQAEMDRLIALLPKKRQNLLFSATLNPDITAITQVLLNKPEVVEIEAEEDRIEQIIQSAYRVKEDKKGPLLRYLIKSKEMKQVLIFTSSVFKADQVVEKLRKNNVDAQAIHSKKSQEMRTKTMRNFKAGHLKVLVATDLIARGIDIEFLPFVINYELPRSPKDYVHRIGRTGRADASGEAISFVTEEDEHHFKIIQKKMKIAVPYLESEELNLHGY